MRSQPLLQFTLLSMPEVLTKYPDVTLKVLKGAGIQCSTDSEPQILTACPPEKFCQLSTGEMCVYGLDEVSQMTQIGSAEIAKTAGSPETSWFNFADIFVLILVFLVAVTIGFFLGRKSIHRN